MGVCTIVYTAMGGMRAVVWTDFVQVIVLMGGAVFAIFFVFNALGSDAIFETAAAFDKTKLVNFSFDLTQADGVGLPVPDPVRRGADVPEGPGADAAHARDRLAESRRPLDLDVRRDHAARRAHLLRHRHGAVCVLQGASRAARSAAADRRDLPAVHRRRAAGRADRADHRRHFRRGDGHAVGHDQQHCDAAVGGFLREAGAQPDASSRPSASPSG